MSDSLSLWDRCLNDLRYQLKENEFTMWLRPLSAHIIGDKLELLAPNQYFVSHVQQHHFAAIEVLAKQHSNGEIRQVVIQVESSVHSGGQTKAGHTTLASAQNGPVVMSAQQNLQTQNEEDADAAQMASDKSLSYINPYFTFETFVSGKSNMLAYKACQELGKKQSQNRHNPLFLYGPSGLGKTHLMHSVAHRYLKIGKTFYYFSSEKFINQLVYALRNQKIEEFKRKIKRVDLLIIDDVHVLAGKNKSSNEFLSLFADFMVEGKQVILASDRHPSQMTEFDERFRSRFSSGLAVAIEPPEMETRMQILQKKAHLSGVDLPKECALFIAQNVVSNVRRLEGALNQVVATANLTGNPIDLDMVQYALKDVIAIRSQAVSMDNIRKVVAEYYDVSVKDLMSKKRTRSIARPRQIAMALARELTKDSFPDIGQSFGGRDHTTVMHACDKIAQLRSEDPVLDKEYKALSMTLQAG
ncbi:chromosomal replication initiator protein DnaA [Psychrobacter sp. YP14]|jgi:chromosomal replication initiator protein|uniref:Chromosomal replication initiator protein DnaA n=4 Tax=Psychrobacter TaxID=497 RepID=A0A844M0N4_9GAMM|nr:MULTISPECIES: chromosomal replication initiator protein DnaA [Psychrobacter]AWT48064.1 chromosomal replication initiator protein DnaA [Psychrobacter sp. YP14]MUG32502.1 chromosomal replication initiator protein DnaA [Psychrobacter sanguinis]